MYALRFSKTAQQTLAKMPQQVAGRMLAELKVIASEPADYRGDRKPLQCSDYWRLRVGDWRAICDLRHGELVLLVVKVAARGDVYK